MFCFLPPVAVNVVVPPDLLLQQPLPATDHIQPIPLQMPLQPHPPTINPIHRKTSLTIMTTIVASPQVMDKQVTDLPLIQSFPLTELDQEVCQDQVEIQLERPRNEDFADKCEEELTRITFLEPDFEHESFERPDTRVGSSCEEGIEIRNSPQDLSYMLDLTGGHPLLFIIFLLILMMIHDVTSTCNDHTSLLFKSHNSDDDYILD